MPRHQVAQHLSFVLATILILPMILLLHDGRYEIVGGVAQTAIIPQRLVGLPFLDLFKVGQQRRYAIDGRQVRRPAVVRHSLWHALDPAGRLSAWPRR